MKKIYKYQLDVGNNELSVPVSGFKPLCVQMQHGLRYLTEGSTPWLYMCLERAGKFPTICATSAPLSILTAPCGTLTGN